MPLYLRSALLLFSLLSCLSVCAQDEYGPPAGETPDTFRIDLIGAQERVKHSLYNRVEVIDERPDTGQLGWLETGSYYGLRVCLASPLDQQLNRVVEQLIDKTADSGRLLIEMRRLLIYDNGQLHVALKFRLFGGNGELYCFVANVDTTFTVRASKGRSGRRKLVAALNGALSDGIARGLTKVGDSTGGYFTRSSVQYADGIWEKRLPLYQSDVYPDGIYLHFSSFAQLRPDYPTFQLEDTAHPEYSLPPQQVYAFVRHGRAYISFDEGYKPLVKKDGEYFITGKVDVEAPGADAAVDLAGFALALAGMGKVPLMHVWGLTVKKKFWFHLDYQTGRFEPVKPVD